MTLNDLTNKKPATELDIERETKELAAIKSIAQLLKQIDPTTTDVPLDDREGLSSLLALLKGSSLNTEEMQLVNKITNGELYT